MRTPKTSALKTALAANPNVTVDDTIDLAVKVWDQLDSYITIKQNLPPDYLTPETPIGDIYNTSDIVLNSLATGLSQNFQVAISLAEIKTCNTFKDIAVLICHKLPT